MKDTSRPRPTLPTRSAPYKKRKSIVSPARGTRRQYDASHDRTHGIISPQSPGRAPSSRCDEAQPSRAVPQRRSRFSAPANRAVSHTLGQTSAGGPTRERPLHMGANLNSTHADPLNLSLRVLPASAPPTANGFNVQKRAESPPPGSVTAFLRSIKLPDKPSSSAPPLQTSFSLNPSPVRPSTANANKAACTNGNGCQVSLVYKGYPFTYDLAALPDDPKGTIALLTITQSDPGAYILVGAHYRRTGRASAACAVIRSLLDTLDTPSNVEQATGDVSMSTTGTSTVTLVSANIQCPKPVDLPMPVFKHTAIRPAMLLLAACELDISRERPDDPESASHAATAHDLFRAVYGTVNDAIIAGAARPQPRNALGLEFSGDKNDPSFSPPPNLNGHPLCNTRPPELDPSESLARVKDMEKELGAARAAQKKLQEKLSASVNRLTRAEHKVHALESRSREVLVQLDASRDENWELHQRLTESEQRARGSNPQCTPSAESRVWGKLKDLLFDNLGGGVRGE